MRLASVDIPAVEIRCVTEWMIPQRHPGEFLALLLLTSSHVMFQMHLRFLKIPQVGVFYLKSGGPFSMASSRGHWNSR
jgi:hypothetical protein